MEPIITHPLNLYTVASGSTREYAVRIRRPVGLDIKNLRVTVDVQSRANATLAVQVNHSPDLGVTAFLQHTANVITDSGSTGISTGSIDGSSDPLGAYLEIVFKVTGSGGIANVVAEVYIEGSAY